MKKLLIATGALAFLFACNKVDEENYAEVAGEVTCQQFKKCEQGYFYSLWDDASECQADYDEYYAEREALFLDLDCEFDLENAAECIAAMQDADCETWYESQSAETSTGFDECAAVWECP